LLLTAVAERPYIRGRRGLSVPPEFFGSTAACVRTSGPGDAMAGLFGIGFDRPSSSDEPPLPRRLLRYLISTAHLGLGSRVLVEGDSAASLAELLCDLGMDVTCDAAPADSPFDAALRIGTGTAADLATTLIAAAILQHSARMMQSVRPEGRFLLVCRIDSGGKGHTVECVERHFELLGEEPHIAVFPERFFAAPFGGMSRRAYAVASCSPSRTAGSFSVGAVREEACCPWAQNKFEQSRAA
jgi:hypothetical protein